MTASFHHTGQIDSVFGPMTWSFSDESNLTFRTPIDGVLVNNIAYRFTCFVRRDPDGSWLFRSGQTHLARVLQPMKAPTHAAYSAVANEAKRLAHLLATDENLRQAEICAIRNIVARIEDDVTEHADTLADLMAERGKQNSRLQVLLAKVEPVPA